MTPILHPERRTRRALKKCPRCGQEMPKDDTPDGCEDRECPVAK